MTQPLECDTHGPTEATYACPHILETLKDGTPRGFHRISDAEGEIQAFCDDCWDATDEEWEWIQEQGPQILCRQCLEAAAMLNEEDADLDD